MTDQEILKQLQDIARTYSSDANTKVAAGVIRNGQLLWGVNKMESYIPPTSITQRDELYYNLMTHAEVDLCRQIPRGSLHNTVVYTTLFSCDACVKVMLDWGLDSKIVALEDRPHLNWCRRSKQLLEAHNVEWTIIP